jgi:diguanylate cyclase (GGDEF)-like protein
MLVKLSVEQDNTMQQDRASLLYGNSTAGMLVTLFVGSFLVYSYPTPETLTFKYTWLVTLYVLVTIRFLDAYLWKKRNEAQDNQGRKAILRYSAGTLVTGVMWATYCIYVFRYASNTESSVIILTMAALAGGAANVLSAHKYTAMGYSFILLVPASLLLLISSNELQHIFGVLGLAYCMTILISANKSSDFTSNAIRLKNENATLVNQMELKVAERTETIYQLSNLDPLTGLYNRSAFMKHFSHMLAEDNESNSPIALLFIDLDGFKKINDTLGHETGDQILKQTSARLTYIQKKQHLLCRWGGDEFLFAYTTKDQPSPMAFATQLIQVISEPYECYGNYHSLSATIGIALSPEHATSADELIQLADTAMYYQKKHESATASLFTHDMRKRLLREQKIKTALSTAIERHQLRLVYQPIVQPKQSTIVAFEALLRWTLDNENIPPDEFIGIAEQYGLINSIGLWVLQQSCLVAANWPEVKGQKPAVSVNVSVIQLNSDSFMSDVREALVTANLPAEKLHIEITESVFAGDKENILERIKKLQATGVQVSIDDFGTEYSSLSAIQALAANTLKIDRSFVQNLDSSGLAIIQAVQNMAATLDYSVIVEGIETQQQAQILCDLGIDMMQGFYFAKPMERDDVKLFLEENA